VAPLVCETSLQDPPGRRLIDGIHPSQMGGVDVDEMRLQDPVHAGQSLDRLRPRLAALQCVQEAHELGARRLGDLRRRAQLGQPLPPWSA
jgi:hypothetical protein